MTEVVARELVKAVCRMIAALPNPVIPYLARILAFCLVPLARKDLKRLRLNVAAVYKLPQGTHFSKMFERQVMFHQIVANLETIKIIQKPESATFLGEQELKAEIEKAELAGNGHIIVTGHLGSWELTGSQCSKQAKEPLNVLAKRSKVKGVTAALEWLRESMGTKVLWNDQKTLLRDMIDILSRGGSLGFVMDQKPTGKGKHLVTFLDRSTEFVAGPAAMVSRTGCAAIAVYCMREAPFRYRLISQTLCPSGVGMGADQSELTQKFAQSISDTIKLYPEQWTWNYKRWRDVV